MIELISATQNDYTPKNDLADITRAYQVQFFTNADEEDIRKALWLLNSYRTIKGLVDSYEFVLKQPQENGLNDFDMAGVEGAVKRLGTSDHVSNLPANVLIAKETRHLNYMLYKRVTEAVLHAANNIVDPHERMIVQLLFVGERKYRYKDAVEYMRKGYKAVAYGIEATTFAEKRRKVIASLANTLLFNGTLDYVTIDYGLGRNKEGEIGLRTLNNRDI
ncbi:hypothetical protein GCM10010912_17790 [Paenibacillus albidus]|uniref:Uncharacterized protein n=1 Tax=Paenibacillus albidus TaxID=2041023 RepID=A0A917FGA0_9BACL|nr:hypothetical protein [Paenibacillus albidus]GGF73019.1 hypothetical protein GCM10010912_17790 [Paenibacillus albidus]